MFDFFFEWEMKAIILSLVPVEVQVILKHPAENVEQGDAEKCEISFPRKTGIEVFRRFII